MSRQVLHLVDHMGLGGVQRILSVLIDYEQHHVYALRSSEKTIGAGAQEINTASSSSRYNLRCFLDVYRIMDSGEFDILQCHLIKSKIAGLLIKIISSRDFSLIFHEHGRVMRDSILYEKFLYLSNRWVDRHITISKEAGNLLEKIGVSSDEIDLIYNFADRRKFNPKEIESFNLGNPPGVDSSNLNESFVLGFAGRIIRKKGWRTLISAFREIDEDMELVIAGSGPEREVLEEEISGLENITYVGYLEDIRELLAVIDCFVLPSHVEGSPMILYEVQSSGVSVIASDAVSVNEIIGDRKNGLLFEPDNVKDLKQKILELKEDKNLRKNLRDSGLEFAKAHTSDEYLDKLSKTYEKTTNREHVR